MPLGEKLELFDLLFIIQAIIAKSKNDLERFFAASATIMSEYDCIGV